MTDTIFPTNPTAEAALLGCILIDPDAIKTVELTPDIFYSEQNRTIAQAMLNLERAGAPIDAITLADELTRMQADVPLSDQLALALAVPSSLNTKYYYQIVATNAGRRAYMRAAQAILDTAVDPSLDLPQIEAKAQSILFAQRALNPTGPQPIAAIVQQTIDELAAVSSADRKPGVNTGLANLDSLLSGLAPGDLIIAAGRPGMGKTAFGLTIAANVARAGQRVAFFSLEMTKQQCTHRLFAANTGIPTDRLRNGLKDPEEWQAIIDAANEIYQWPMLIDDTPSLHIDKLMSTLRSIHAQDPLALVIVDYLQLLTTTPSRNSNREQEVSHISQCLKALGKDLNIPILALAQLSRALETRADKRPRLSDLRESGAIEMNADIVMFLYRDDYYNEASETPGVTETIVGKHRNGPTGTIPLYFNKERTTFQDINIIRTELDY